MVVHYEAYTMMHDRKARETTGFQSRPSASTFVGRKSHNAAKYLQTWFVTLFRDQISSGMLATYFFIRSKSRDFGSGTASTSMLATSLLAHHLPLRTVPSGPHFQAALGLFSSGFGGLHPRCDPNHFHELIVVTELVDSGELFGDAEHY